MSERPVEDEIIAETKDFAAKLAALARRHALAGNWLERRRVRREISLTMRQQRREEQQTREHQLAWTSQMVNRYQVHLSATELRRTDPRVSRDQRIRDIDAVAGHADDVRARIMANTHLTEVERGIALEAVDVVTEDPQYRPGPLFKQAHKVRGLDALGYRAIAASERQGMRRDQQWGRPKVYDRDTSGQPDSPRPGGQLNRGQSEAVQDLRQIQLTWNAEAPNAHPWKRSELSKEWARAARVAQRQGLTPERIEWEFRNAEANSAFIAQVQSARGPGQPVRTIRTVHATEADAARWTDQHLNETRWAPGIQIRAAIQQRGAATPVRVADGGLEHVTANTALWARPEQAAHRDDELASLTERHRLSIEHNGELSDRNAALTRQLAALTAERDEYRQQRDEAVQKLAERTPPAERLGSPERQAAQAKRASIPGHAFAGLVNGHDREREGTER
ncbi:hypothetical protein [Nocardia grenadensis]